MLAAVVEREPAATVMQVRESDGQLGMTAVCLGEDFGLHNAISHYGTHCDAVAPQVWQDLPDTPSIDGIRPQPHPSLEGNKVRMGPAVR